MFYWSYADRTSDVPAHVSIIEVERSFPSGTPFRPGREAATLSPLDRLAYLGTRTMGALTFHPPANETHRDHHMPGLHALGQNAEQIFS